MAHTNETSNYELSQFVGTDKPAWLVDYNGDMLKIDAAIKENADDITQIAGDVTTLQNEVGSSGLTGRITTIENDIDNIETEIGSVTLPTTAQSLTGAIAELKSVNDTQNTNISNNATAIAQVTGSIEGVSQLAYTIANVYDSTSTYAIGDYAIVNNTLYKCITAITVGESFDASKWTSVKVMDEIPSGGGGGSVVASNVSYDNTSSGLTASNVQSAIDEVNNKIPTIVATTEAQRGTIEAGSTSATLTFDGTIGANTFVDWYVGDGTITPDSVTTTSNTVVITIPVQNSTVIVGAVIRN